MVRYGITKRMLQLFFKNRCQQKQRRKRKKSKMDEPRSTEELGQNILLDHFVPIAPAPHDYHVNSLLDMVRGDEFEVKAEETPSLIDTQTFESYQPSAHLPSTSQIQ